MGTLQRYVLRSYAQFLVGIFGIVLAIFLVTDFVDRSKAYTGPNVVRDVAELYGYKALVFTHQLGSAILLLAAGACVSALRKRGEITAIGALSFGPSALYVPIGLLALMFSGGLVAFDEYVVTDAAAKVEQITVHRFQRWGDYRFYFFPKQWYRRADRLFYLRGGDADSGFRDVTILTVTPTFQLARRVDAKQMTHLSGTMWRLDGLVDRTFADQGATKLSVADSQEVDLGAGPEGFRVRMGRPEQMRLSELTEQIRTRTEVGLPTRQFSLGFHNRFAYPFAGLPAALLAVGLALRPNRKGNLTTAMIEGLVVAVTLWGLMVVCRTLVLAERMSPVLAAWAPFVVLTIAAALLWRRLQLGSRRRAS